LSLAAVLLTAGGCTKFKSAYDWVAAGDSTPEVAQIGSDNPDLYQRALPMEVTATIPAGPPAAPEQPLAGGYPLTDNPQSNASSDETLVAAMREPVLPDLPPERVRKVAYTPPPPPRPRDVPPPVAEAPARPPGQVQPVRPPEKVQPVETATGRSLYADPQEPDEMLAAQQSVGNDSLSKPPADAAPRPIRVASADASVPLGPAPRDPGRAANASPPPVAIPPAGTPAASKKPAPDQPVGPKKNVGRSTSFDWLLLDKGRHTREMTPVERLRATRRLLTRRRTAAMAVPAENPTGVTPPRAGLGLQGPADQGAAPFKPPAQASLQPGSTATGLAQTATPQKSPTPAPTNAGGQSAIPNRERPMRIYFAPGKKKLSSQTISSIVSVAEAQRTIKRLVHVVGVAAAKGGEGNGFNTETLNRLAL